MAKQMTPEEYMQFRDRAGENAIKMMDQLETERHDEILSAAMTLITFVLCASCKEKDHAYSAMAALFEIGDKMIQEADAAGAVRWKGYKDFR